MGRCFITIFTRTVANALLVVVGATALALAAEDHRLQGEIARSDGFLLFPYRRRFDWQRTIQKGITVGMGLIMTIVGVVRQIDVERHARNSSFGCDATPLILMGTFVALSNSEGGSCSNGEQYEDESEDDDDNDCDVDEIWDLLFSTYVAVRPSEDDSVGAEPVEHSINRGNDRVIIRNDIMLTIRKVVNSFNARDDSISVNEQTNNDFVYGGNDSVDDVYQDMFARFPVEQESIDLVSNLDYRKSAQ